jgi:ABC-type multidrug transport system permease subunit
MLPVSQGIQWILGKSLPYIALGFVELAICFGFGMVMFQYRIPTDPTGMLVATFFYLVAGVFFGMLLGNATGTQSAAIQGVQMGAFLLSLLLSDFLFPVRNIPAGIRWIAMLKATDTDYAPWHIIRSDDKKRARLNCISHLLDLIPWKQIPRKKIKLPKRSNKGFYDDQATLEGRRFIPEKY